MRLLGIMLAVSGLLLALSTIMLPPEGEEQLREFDEESALESYITSALKIKGFEVYWERQAKNQAETNEPLVNPEFPKKTVEKVRVHVKNEKEISSFNAMLVKNLERTSLIHFLATEVYDKKLNKTEIGYIIFFERPIEGGALLKNDHEHNGKIFRTNIETIVPPHLRFSALKYSLPFNEFENLEAWLENQKRLNRQEKERVEKESKMRERSERIKYGSSFALFALGIVILSRTGLRRITPQRDKKVGAEREAAAKIIRKPYDNNANSEVVKVVKSIAKLDDPGKEWESIVEKVREFISNEVIEEKKVALQKIITMLEQEPDRRRIVKARYMLRKAKEITGNNNGAGRSGIRASYESEVKISNNIQSDIRPQNVLEISFNWEEFEHLLPIDDFLPKNGHNPRCVKALIIAGFLRPSQRGFLFEKRYLPREKIVDIVVGKKFSHEEVEKCFDLLIKEGIILKQKPSQGDRHFCSLRGKPRKVQSQEGREIVKTIVRAAQIISKNQI